MLLEMATVWQYLSVRKIATGIVIIVMSKKNWDPESASTLTETYGQIDEIYKKGFRVLNNLGGETLATCARKGEIVSGGYKRVHCLVGVVCHIEDPDNPIIRAEEEPFRTKDGLTFAEHATAVIDYASKKGMVTNITSNGDFLTPENYSTLEKLKKAGLDFMILSDHSKGVAGFKNLVAKARAIANEGIVPMISRVFTKDRVDTIPLFARTCVANGVLFSTSLVQEIGQGFSKVPAESQIPTAEQIQEVFQELQKLKRTGFVRNNLNYLTCAQNFPNNSWRCDPEKDTFIHVRAQGEKGDIGVCPEIRTGFNTTIDLNSDEWRQRKKELVDKCRGCLFSCYFECENPDFRSDLSTLLPIMLIRSGHAGSARWLGRRAVGKDVIIDVPESDLERTQIRWKHYDSLEYRIRSTTSDLVDTVAGYATMAVVIPAVILYGAKHGMKPGESLRALANWFALRGM